MTARRLRSKDVESSASSTTSGPVNPELPSAATAPLRKRHLEGLAFYAVYVPAWIVAGLCVWIFMAAVERVMGDDE